MINPMKLITKWFHFRIFEMGLDSNNKRPHTTLANGFYFLLDLSYPITEFLILTFHCFLIRNISNNRLPEYLMFFHLIFFVHEPFYDDVH